MPLLNGYEICKLLKNMVSEGKIEKLYVVAVTADVTQQNV